MLEKIQKSIILLAIINFLLGFLFNFIYDNFLRSSVIVFIKNNELHEFIEWLLLLGPLVIAFNIVPVFLVAIRKISIGRGIVTIVLSLLVFILFWITRALYLGITELRYY